MKFYLAYSKIILCILELYNICLFWQLKCEKVKDTFSEIPPQQYFLKDHITKESAP